MTIADIHKKILAGETLADAERDFLSKFDLDAIANNAAAAARRKAEEETRKRDAEIVTLKEQLDAAKQAAEAKGSEGQSEIQRLTGLLGSLQKKFDAMEKKAKDAEAENARVKRVSDIDAYAKEHGILPAKGIKGSAFMRFFRDAVGDTDLGNEEAMKAVVDAFKTEYAGMFVNDGIAVPDSGKPGGGIASFGGVNPFKKETENATAQYEIYKQDPALAKRLAAEAGVSLE